MYSCFIARNYLSHFIKNPHSLIVKILGVYDVQIGSKTVLFFIMHSVFFPETALQKRFDIKGCLAGRYQAPGALGTQNTEVFKDKNFLGEQLILGEDRRWFLRQVKISKKKKTILFSKKIIRLKEIQNF